MGKFFAVAAMGLVPVAATAESVLYGTLNVHYDVVDSNGLKQYQFNDQGTRVGIRGAQYLNEDLEASYILEADTRLAADDDPEYETRQAWLGLRGTFGEIRFGKHLSPTQIAVDPVDLFGDQAADLGKVLEADREFDRSVAYINWFNGIGYAAALSKDNGSDRLSADLLVNYDSDSMYLAGAYLHGADKKNIVRLAATYRFPAGHSLGAAYEHQDDTKGSDGHDAYAINGAYQLGKALLKTQLGWNNPEKLGTTETLFGVGVDYQWSKPLTLELQYSLNQHRDHSKDDEERALTVGFAYQF